LFLTCHSKFGGERGADLRLGQSFQSVFLSVGV
jgi:hypothetical protein